MKSRPLLDYVREGGGFIAPFSGDVLVSGMLWWEDRRKWDPTCLWVSESSRGSTVFGKKRLSGKTFAEKFWLGICTLSQMLSTWVWGKKHNKTKELLSP